MGCIGEVASAAIRQVGFCGAPLARALLTKSMLGKVHARAIALVVALALLPACSSDKTTPTNANSSGGPVEGSIANLTRGSPKLSLLSSPSPVNPGKNRFAFDLVAKTGGVAAGGSPQVYIALDAHTKALGPFSASWYKFTGYKKTGDTSPRTNLPGTYSAEINIPTAGTWQVAVVLANGSQRFVATGTIPATTDHIPAALGSKAISVKTPVAKDLAGIARICTRKPVDHMHYISLAAALKNGKPTVVNFGTPLLCESRLCGPVIDEVILAFQKYGPAKANFVHVEEFLPGPDLKPPPATLANASPAFKTWGFQTEPWVVVIDGKGVIRARFEGPVTAPEIEAALRPLLK